MAMNVDAVDDVLNAGVEGTPVRVPEGESRWEKTEASLEAPEKKQELPAAADPDEDYYMCQMCLDPYSVVTSSAFILGQPQCKTCGGRFFAPVQAEEELAQIWIAQQNLDPMDRYGVIGMMATEDDQKIKLDGYGPAGAWRCKECNNTNMPECALKYVDWHANDYDHCYRCYTPVSECFGGMIPHVTMILCLKEIFRKVKGGMRSSCEEGPLSTYLKYIEAQYGPIDRPIHRVRDEDEETEVVLTRAMIVQVQTYVARPMIYDWKHAQV